MDNETVVLCPFCDGEVGERALEQCYYLCPYCLKEIPVQEAKRIFLEKVDAPDQVEAFETELGDTIVIHHQKGLSYNSIRRIIAAVLTTLYRQLNICANNYYRAKEIFPLEVIELAMVFKNLMSMCRELNRDRAKEERRLKDCGNLGIQ